MIELANKKLLIIEDDISFANALTNNMQRRKLVVLHAVDNTSALEISALFVPDFILLDLKLGRTSGLALIEPLREMLPNVRMVLLTGYASIATAVDAIKKGADDYLPKPTNTAAIIAALTGANTDNTTALPVTPMSPSRLEWEHIQKTLQENHGNISMTARALGLHRRTLQRKLDKKPTIR